VTGPRLRDSDTALSHVERLGWKGADCFAPAHEAATAGDFRYRAHHIAGARFDLIPPNFQGDDWMGFSGVRPFGPDLAIIPLPGRAQLGGGNVPFGLKFFQRVADDDRTLARRNRARLADLARERASEVRVFSAHDPTEFLEFA